MNAFAIDFMILRQKLRLFKHFGTRETSETTKIQ